MGRALRVLHVEDNERDAALLKRHLVGAGYAIISERVETPEAMRAALADKEWDVVLCDYAMPQFSALAALAILKETGLDVPLIIVSGTIGEESAVEAMRAGAHDYLMKDRLARLTPAIERERHEAENRRARRQAELALRTSEAELRAIFAAITDVIIVLDAEGRYLRIAPTNPTYLIKPPAELLGKRLHEVFPQEQADFFLECIRRALVEGRIHGLEYSMQLDGVEVWFDGIVSPMSEDSVIWIARDITERRRAEIAMRESGERFRQLAENIRDVFWMATPDIKEILYVSPAYESVWGRPKESLRTEPKAFLEAIHPEDRERVADNLMAGRSHGFEIEYRVVRPDGQVRWIWDRGFPVRDVSGEIYRIAGLAEDITDRKLAEQELKESEERYRDLVENARDVIYTHDLEGNYTSVNKAGERLLGYSREEVAEMNIRHTVAPEWLKTAQQMLAKKLVGDGETVYDLELVAKDGRHVGVEVNTRLLYQNGVPVGVQGIARDITERKRVEGMQRRRAAQAALRADINAALAETNTPLRRILERCAAAMVRHLDAACARIWTLNQDENTLELQASAGVDTHADNSHACIPVGKMIIGVIAAERRPYLTDDMQADSLIDDKEWAEREGLTAFAGYPLLVEGRLVGVMGIFARARPADDTLDTLASIADIISQGIERKRALEALRASEEQLRQSQKLEAIGQLAGGVAHDFNNLLTVINGYSDMLLQQLRTGEPARRKVEEIKRAGERAASLTRQLLAFSRKQVLQPKVLSLNAVISDMDKMLRRLIGEDIDLMTVLDPTLGHVRADPGQIEQVLLNLVVNARDAMPQGGKLTVETANVNLDGRYAGAHLAVRPGRYTMLAVSDTGRGMTDETKARIFEPFFTTKELGKGTGLGLSTVYGIVKQSGGNIWVYSEVGRGTTFKLYLPRVDEPTSVAEAEVGTAEPPRGRETVLLVEDEGQVRQMARDILEMSGYKVLEAAGGEEALTLFRAQENGVDLIMTDVVMQGMSGPELAQKATALLPGVKVLFMSGYTDDAVVRHGLIDQEISFLQKPFTADAFMRKVREVLDASEEE